MKTSHKWLAVPGLVLVLGLSGCWDSDDEPGPTPASTEVPDSAGVSVAAFIGYLLSLSGSDESSEPLTIKDTLAVPADESAEPTPLT